MSSDPLSHLNHDGTVHMVDVSTKPESVRRAVAEGRLYASSDALAAVREGRAAKGDVLAVARVAAIMACKRTPDWIPLCHVIGLSGVEVNLELEPKAIRVEVEVHARAVTGVEMEALTGVSAALLTMYDMLKGVDRGMHLGDIRLLLKSGGQSGPYVNPG